MSLNNAINKALKLPRGARFYKCALQVNPYEYLKRHSKPTSYSDEDSYNKAIIKGCKEKNVEVISITDHYNVKSGNSLRKAAVKAGLHVFPGFEAVTKEGVHFLCIFDPDRSVEELERFIGDCGIHDQSIDSPTGDYDARELLERSRQKWNGVCIGAHVASDGGLLRTLKGQSRMNVWKYDHFMACSLPGPASDAPEEIRPILENKNMEHKRNRPVAILNAQDVNSPGDLDKPGVCCWIKMSEISIEGLRQAFLDPASRIRLVSDPVPEEHVELVAISWQGGFLDEQAINFNENLNVLIGGRGSGKSTIVESLRYVLDLNPLGEEAYKMHEGIVRQVLRNGTKISLLVRSYRPAKQEYLIERTIPNQPVVRDLHGQVLDVTPQDILSNVEVYGQHEISELARSKEKLTRLLERFVEKDIELIRHKEELKRELAKSRTRIMEVRSEISATEERIARLPVLEETLRHFQELGLEDKLREQSLLVREERIFKTVPERLAVFRDLLMQLQKEIPLDRTFLSSKAVEELPNRNILKEIDIVFETLSPDLETVAGQLKKAIDQADNMIDSIRQRWLEKYQQAQSAYEKILRDLQKSSIDGEEFIKLRRQIEGLRPLKERLNTLKRDIIELQKQRRNLMVEWEDAKSEEFRQLEKAAKKVNRQLPGRVRVQVNLAGNREPLFELLKDNIGGRLSETIEALRRCDELSLAELSHSISTGKDTVNKKFGIPPSQADRLAGAKLDVIMQIEEIDLPSTTDIELNIAAEGQQEIWKLLDDLSTGQKATAVLLLLLLESDAPVIVDQPEDDLDNRFVTEGVVPKIREEKRKRQFIFSTHNANIPVLGDAELIIGLIPSGEAGKGYAQIPMSCMGSIDTQSVKGLVEEILEGGKEAFEMRRLKYGF